MTYLLRFALIIVCACSFWGCHTCNSVADDIDAFVENHDNQKCKVDADCVVVGTGCADAKNAFCGQVAISREAAESAEWKDIESTRESACDKTCTTCLALLNVACSADGLCADYGDKQ